MRADVRKFHLRLADSYNMLGAAKPAAITLHTVHSTSLAAQVLNVTG